MDFRGVKRVFNAVDNPDNTIDTPQNYEFTVERDPVTGVVVPTQPRTLTQAQICYINAIEQDQNTEPTNNVNPPGISDIFAQLPIDLSNKSVGDIITSNNPSLSLNNREYNGRVDLSRFHVRLLDEIGNTINLNSNNWSFTLKCQRLYANPN